MLITIYPPLLKKITGFPQKWKTIHKNVDNVNRKKVFHRKIEGYYGIYSLFHIKGKI